MNNRIGIVYFVLFLQTTCFAMQPIPNEYGQICVPSIGQLSCNYSYKNKSKDAYLPLKLDDSTYHKMAYMCTAIKILNGFLLGKGNIKEDLDIKDSSYTPEPTNVLVPYLGFVERKEGELKYTHRPSKNKDGKCVVFISGKSGATPEQLMMEK